MPKRKRDDSDVLPSIFEINDILKHNIAPYLFGRDLKHFKMLNKCCLKAAKEMDCSIHIEASNFREACLIRGYHFISVMKMHEDGRDIRIMREEGITFPDVEYLTIDFESNYSLFIIDNILPLFPELKEMRIIRAQNPIELDITKDSLPKIERLSIYAHSFIDIKMDRDIDEMRLYVKYIRRINFQIFEINEIDRSMIKSCGGGLSFYSYPFPGNKLLATTTELKTSAHKDFEPTPGFIPE